MIPISARGDEPPYVSTPIAEPLVEERGRGRLVAIGSMDGFLPMPFEPFYGASKHALEGYVESLDVGISSLGLRALLIEPGCIKTNFSANRATTATTIAANAKMRAAIARSRERGVSKGATSDAVARAVEPAITAPRPRSERASASRRQPSRARVK